jgi:homoserine dehydrogenase
VPGRIVVLKFGSSVLKCRADLPAAVHEIYRWYRAGARVIAVISAVGDATEQLIRQSRELSATPEPWATAELLATGERTSAALLGIALDRAGIPARVVNPREIGLEVKGEPLDGEPFGVNIKHVEELLAEYAVLVVPGFFGTDASGRTQLLGRGGSDLTAVFLGVSLGAERVRLLKDRDGIFESDPAVEHSYPKRFATLNYADALRVAGKMIQPKAVAFLKGHQARAEVAALARPYQTVVHGGDTELARGAPSEVCSVVMLGLGTVGFGVYQRLLASPDQFRVLGVLVRDRKQYENAGVPSNLLHTTVKSLGELRPTLVLDALPGVEPSGALVESYLSKGVDVVSANKTVIAHRGDSLDRLAQTSGARLRYAAAVGGSAPMLELVSSTGERGEIESIAAVLNGTCNFVLDRCAEGAALEDAVAEAQRCGFAETEPSDDLSGRDAERKLRILAWKGFGVTLDTVALQALTDDVAKRALSAAGAGAKLRQIARLSRQGSRVVATLEFEPAKPGSLFCALIGEWNALEVKYANGEIIALRGRGAGRWPTTEAVMADIFDVVRAPAASTQLNAAPYADPVQWSTR